MGNMTIKDIARISGCSVSTISRVINDRPDVRPETKERVLEVMREAGFVPNTNARQLKIQQSRSLVFVVKGTRNIFFSDFLVQLQRAATLYGYSGIVSYLDENANEIDAAEKILRRDQTQRHDFPGRQRRKLPERICQHQRPFGAGHPRVGQAGLSQSVHGWRG